MKKTLVLFALVDLSVAVVVLSAVHGQTKTRNHNRFPRIVKLDHESDRHNRVTKTVRRESEPRTGIDSGRLKAQKIGREHAIDPTESKKPFGIVKRAHHVDHAAILKNDSNAVTSTETIRRITAILRRKGLMGKEYRQLINGELRKEKKPTTRVKK